MNSTEMLAIQPNIYYTVDETAHLLRVSRSVVLRLLRSREAQGVKIGRQWRVLGAALLDMSAPEKDSEERQVEEWLAASMPSLMEVWDNEGDAIYDHL